jgi:hypothetical protein
MAIVKKEPLEIVLRDESRKEIGEATDLEISGYLSMLDERRKKIDGRVKEIKDYVKTNRIKEGDFDKDNHVMFGEHRLTRYVAYRFDEDKFLENGTQEEKEVFNKWKEIESRYQKGNSIIKF